MGNKLSAKEEKELDDYTAKSFAAHQHKKQKVISRILEQDFLICFLEQEKENVRKEGKLKNTG